MAHGMQVRVVGVAWYRREDWKEIRRIMADRHVLPRHYKQWLEGAEKTLDHLRLQGVLAEKAYIDPETFPDWCRARGMDIDAKARTTFAAETVARKYQDQS